MKHRRALPFTLTVALVLCAAVHRAIGQGDLPGVTVGGRQFVLRAAVAKFTPRAYAGRPSSKPRGRSKSQEAQEAQEASGTA